jgi:hypothetical protein
MSQLLPFVAAFAAFAAVAGGLMWLATRVRRRGVGGDVMAVVDDVFRPTAHQSHYELQAQDERRAPMSAPDGE